MKNFKSLMLAAIAALACVTLPSCSDDDDGPGGSKSDLIGVWESTHATGWEKEDGVITEQWDYDDTDLRYEFMADGRCIEYERNSGGWGSGSEYTYTYSGGTLSMTWDDGHESSTARGKVKKLSDSDLEVEFTYSEREDGIKYEGYQLISFRKISGGNNGGNGNGGDTPSQYAAKIPGTWMQARADYLWPSGTVTDNFNAYSYKFISVTYNERSGDFTFNWLSNPSLSILSSKTYKLNGDKIMEGNSLRGTIEKCNPSSSGWDAMTIVWEVDAEPFNLGADCRTRGYYMLKTW